MTLSQKREIPGRKYRIKRNFADKLQKQVASNNAKFAQ